MHTKSTYVELQTRQYPSTPDLSTEQRPPIETIRGRPWKNGFRRLPVLGLIALLGTALCTGVSVYVLIRSNGQPVETWHPLQPTVYLAVCSSVANVLHSFALGEGLVVAWWQTAVKQTTLQKLHYTWHSGTSVKGALINLLLGREILMAVACLLTTLSIARGPLFQRASSVQQATVPSNGTVELHVAQELQFGYAGQISGRTTSPSFMTPVFTRVVQAYNKGDAMEAVNSGCPPNTTCSAEVRGFGFGVQCNDTKLPYLMENQDGGGLSFNEVDVFVTAPGYGEIFGFGGAEELDENYKPSRSTTGNNALLFNNTYLDETIKLTSVGHLRNRMCSLRAGIVSYPVTISNGSSLNLRSSSWKDDTFLENRGFFGIEGTTESNLAGFYLAASYLFSGTATLSFGGGVGYILNIEGLTAAQYLDSNGTSIGTGSFDTTWSDPTDDILNAMREIAFRAALQVGQNTSYPNSTQQLLYTGEHQQTIYRSDHRFTVAAAAVSLLGVFAILPTFFGFTRLGRAVSLSPLEIAKAFDAPVLRDVAGNVAVDEMLDQADKANFRYGELGSEIYQDGSSVVHRLAIGPASAGIEARRGVLYM